MRQPTELHIYDFDSTLYHSPAPPVPEESNMWYFHAKSLGLPDRPGFDHRWILPVLIQARRSQLNPSAALVLLTARPDHKAMREILYRTLALTDIKWDAVKLKPIFFPGSDAAYKASTVKQWLEAMPSIKKVVFYDDQRANLEAVALVVQAKSKKYEPIWTAESL